MDNEATVCTSSQPFRAVQIQFNSQRNHGQADHVNLKRTNKKKNCMPHLLWEFTDEVLCKLLELIPL